MFDHFGFCVRDLGAARRFYEEAMAALGLAVIDNTAASFLVIRSIDEPLPFLWIGTDRPAFWRDGHGASTSPVHLCFTARDREAVDTFHRRAVAAGGSDNGAPGPRREAYYGAYVLDPDGNNVEAGYRG